MKAASSGARPYVPRILDPRLEAALGALPAALVVGPRAAGKTTTARRLAATTVRLDRAAEAVAFQADPDAALRGLAEPVLLDEWQAVPGVLGAVKRAVDDDPRPGRFLVTGSVRADLEEATWPGTGRLVRLCLFGLTVRERRGGSATRWLVDRIGSDGPGAALQRVADPPDLRGYLDLALRGGFPEAALQPDPDARALWLDSYVDQLLTRDVELVDGGRDPDRLRRYLEAFAHVTGQVVEDKTLWEAAGVNRKTALAYEQLLKNLFVIDTLPAWSANRLKQLVRSPKRFVVDAGVAAALLRTDATGALRDGRLLGALLETFVVSQVRAEAAASPSRPRLYHVRDHGGRHEVDLLVELGRGQLIAVEVKATAAPTKADARHLEWLRDATGADFVAGLVLHTGPHAFALGDRVVAAPIAALWS